MCDTESPEEDASVVPAPAMPSVHLKTSLLVPELHNERFPLTHGALTARELIIEIGRRTHVELLDRDGELIDFLDVRVNGLNVSFLSAGLDTTLCPDDDVLIRLIPIGGG